MDNKTPKWFAEIMQNESKVKKNIGLFSTDVQLGMPLQTLVDHINAMNKKNEEKAKKNITKYTDEFEPEQSYIYVVQETSKEIAVYMGEILTRKELESVMLMCSDFADEEVNIIAEYFNNKISVTTLGFINCKITDRGALVLMKALTGNYRLKVLALDSNIDKNIIQRINALTERNKNLSAILKKSIPINFVMGIVNYILPREIVNNIVYHIFLSNFHFYKPPTFIEKCLDSIEDNFNNLSNWSKSLIQ